MLLDVVNNLLLYVEPRRKEAMERLQRLRFQLQIHSVENQKRPIQQLQNTVRYLVTKLRRLVKETYLVQKALAEESSLLSEMERLESRVYKCKEQLSAKAEGLDVMLSCYKEITAPTVASTSLKDNLASSAGYNVVEQIRTKEEPDEPYQYEAVLVIHKDLEIFDVHSLRGLNSCHTGVGRNVGYKSLITKLTAMGVLTNINDPEYSVIENEIRALSTLFNKGYFVGKWSPDPVINKRMKETYSNICAFT